MTQLPLRLFVSYAREDDKIRRELREHLAPLRHQGLIIEWSDRQIVAGSDWENEILDNLDHADLIVLLVSAKFIDSGYCIGVEMGRALERHASGTARVIPVIARNCYWQGISTLASLQVLPPDARAITAWRDKNSAYLEVVLGIQDAALRMRSGSPAGATDEVSPEHAGRIDLDSSRERAPSQNVPDSLDTPGLEPPPGPPRERLLVVSASDLRQVRQEAVTMLNQLMGRLAPDHLILAYDGEPYFAGDSSDLSMRLQAEPSRPAEPGCVGVICLLGERIGVPLEDGFPASGIPGWARWSDPGCRYRVVHPWPKERVRQLELVNGGAFPLTSTVYAVLDALGVSRKLHVACFADRPVDDPAVRFNGLSWLMRMQVQIQDTGRLAEWLRYDYTIEVQSVANFVNALNEWRSGVPVYQTDRKALAAIREWVETQVVPRRPPVDNPYHSLDFYDIHDGDDLPARSTETRKAVAALKERSPGSSGRPMIVRISGESGCGKTSFMRAGILAALNHPEEQGRFRVVAVRPADLHDEHGRPHRNLPLRLLDIIRREIADLGLTANAYGRVAGAGPRTAQTAVEVLVQTLFAGGEDALTLVIGLDQFEEILDDLGAADRPYAVGWIPLLTFVELAVTSGRIGFVYTLESSRQKLFESVELPAVFRSAHEVPLGGASDPFLTAVITEPFRKKGYRVAPETVNALIASYRSYSEKTGGYASLLPLLSLKLFNLFEIVRSRRSAPPRAPSEHGLPGLFDDQQVEVPHDEVKDDLQLDSEVAELAGRAWGVREEPVEEQLDDLNLFLTPLVGLSGEEMDQITLKTVGETLFVNLEEQLTAFQNVRLVIRENGRRRLVHEAVVRQWPLAARWLERKREYLTTEAQCRTDANTWARSGPGASLPGDEASIDTAAAVLHGYLLEWPHAEESALSVSDRELKKYCEAILRQSETPERMDSRQARRGYAHVHVAAAYGMTDLLEKFVALRPDCLAMQTARGSTPIDQAAWTSAATTRFLLEKGAVVNVDGAGWPTISCAVWRNDPETFRVLLPFYRTPESIATPDGTNLLHIAARRGTVGMAATLLATIPGLDPMARDVHGRTPLDYAAMSDQPEAFNFFQEHWTSGAPLAQGWTVLHYAAYFGASRVIDEILSFSRFGALVDARDELGQTALMLAAQQRHEAVVRRLVAVMDPNAQVPEGAPRPGWTALHFAVSGPQDGKSETRSSRHQALQTVRALLEAESTNPNLAGMDGKVPLSLAGRLPHVFEALVSDARVVSGARFPDGTTPLNLVIESKNRLAVERILRSPDVDADLLDADGNYALNLLIRNDMADLALGLFQAGRVKPWNATEANGIGLAAAIDRGHEPLVSAYLETLPEERGPWHRHQLTLALRAALMNERADALMERLLSLGAEPASRISDDGWTLFHEAALVGNLQAFDRFAQVSPGTSRRDRWGRRPSDLAPDHLRAHFAIRMKDLPDDGFFPEQPDRGSTAAATTRESP